MEKIGSREASAAPRPAGSPWRRAALGMAALIGLLPAHAALADGGTADTLWTCWHGNATALICQLSSVATADSPDALQPAPIVPAGNAEGAGKRSFALANAILRSPGELRGRRIVIPMFSEPEDRAFMIELAEAVMCGVRPRCAVEFLQSISEVALALDEAGDPALN